MCRLNCQNDETIIRISAETVVLREKSTELLRTSENYLEMSNISKVKGMSFSSSSQSREELEYHYGGMDIYCSAIIKLAAEVQEISQHLSDLSTNVKDERKKFKRRGESWYSAYNVLVVAMSEADPLIGSIGQVLLGAFTLGTIIASTPEWFGLYIKRSKVCFTLII